MSEKMEYTGKDVSQAIARACESLGVDQDGLDIDVITPGSAGILGIFGKKAAVIAVSLKKQPGKKNILSPERREEKKKAAQSPKKGGRRSQHHSRRPADQSPAEISADDLEAVKETLARLLELSGFSAEITISSEANKIRAHVDGDQADDIVGTEGQTLDSLQYLMRKMISRRIKGRVLFSLDAGGYRERRGKELEERAVALAAEVRETGRTKSIPALNPAERRIVHMRLQDDSSIRSRSVGDGHFKKILIYVPGRNRKK